MFMNNAYINDSLLNYKDTKNPLTVLSCGTYKLNNMPKLPTYRPKGRLDYQLIYIASGKAHFYFDEKEEGTVINAGTFVLFKPKDFQKYVYYGIDKTEAYWIHFTGFDVKNILNSCGISGNTRILKVGTNPLFQELFSNIIIEIQQKKTAYEHLIKSYFMELIINIGRSANENSNPESYINKQMKIAQEYFSENYNKEINIDEYANVNGMSISWFIRSFKAYTGNTPLQYILNIRMANAQALLESTDYTINEISNIIGYDNQLYFSRLFRKQKGMSPKQYRKSLM